MSKKTKLSLLIVAMFVLALFVAFQNKYLVSADASTPIKHLSGYAWSPNIGWISFSGGGFSPLYEVTYNSDPLAGGLLSGYAWSSNIGWISFGCGQPDGNTGRTLCNESGVAGTPSYPTGNGVTRSGPKIDVSSGKLVGFARACSVFASGCSGPFVGGAASPDTSMDLGGWDGWISLSGLTSETSPNAYGVTFDSISKEFNGYAWGGGSDYSLALDPARNISPEVPGWISFKNSPGESNAYGVVMNEAPTTVSTVLCDKNPYPVVNVPVVWTATVNPPGQYSYRWNIGGTSGTDYQVLSGDVNSDQSITVRYKVEGPQTTDVIVTTSDGTVVGSCPSNVSHFDVLPLGFVISHDGDMSARYLKGRGITTVTFPNTPLHVTAQGDYTSAVRLVFKRIENASHVTIGSANSADGIPLIVEAQFTSDTQTTPASSVTLSKVGGVYGDASLRLILTKNQNAGDLPLPTGDYNVIIDSDSGGHEHAITLHLSNPSGGVIER